MQPQVKSIRPFIGAKDFQYSRSFYQDLKFQEVVISPELSVFLIGSVGFYLQAYYIEDWVNNTMLFLEVEDTDQFWNDLAALHLTEKYPEVKISPVRTEAWGKECFVHDPAGNLWHFGEFFAK